MKKALVLLCMLAMLTVGADMLFAATGHGLNPYRSADWVRNPSRCAVTDSLDAITYNPAGIVKMADGFYVGLGNIVILKESEHEVGGTTYSADDPSWIIPTVYLAYNQQNWSLFLNFESFDGGGGYEFSNSAGLPLFSAGLSASLTASGMGTAGVTNAEVYSSWTQLKLGGAFELNNMVSFSAGIRYLMGKITSEMTATGASGAVAGKALVSETEQNYTGMGGFVGINVAPVEGLNLSATYFTKVWVAGEEDKTLKVNGATMSDTSEFEQEVVPAQLFLGASYQVMPALSVSVSYLRTFSSEESFGKGTNEEYLFRYQDDEQNLAIGVEYTVMPMLTVSAGLGYAWKGGAEETYQAEFYNPDLDVLIAGLGAKITPMPGLDVTVGLMKAFFMEETSGSGASEITYNRDAWLFSLGASYKAF